MTREELFIGVVEDHHRLEGGRYLVDKRRHRPHTQDINAFSFLDIADETVLVLELIIAQRRALQIGRLRWSRK